MRTISLVIILSLFTSVSTFCQSDNSKFYPDGYGKLYARKNIFAVSIDTKNTTDLFYNELTRRFGSPIIAGEFIIYKCVNKKWADRKVVIRISKGIQTNLDGSSSNILFIFVETTNHIDLLNPKLKSSNKIKTYFNTLFQNKIVPAPLDSFTN